MKVKLTALIDALNAIKYDYSSYDGEICDAAVLDISISEESIDNAVYLAVLKVSAQSQITHINTSSYVEGKTSMITRTVELYPHESNVESCFTKSTTRVLKRS